MTHNVMAKHFETDQDVATELDAQFLLWRGLNPSTPWAEVHKRGSFIAALVQALDG